MIRRVAFISFISLMLFLNACRFMPGEYRLTVLIPPLPAELAPYLEGGGWLTVSASGLSPERIRARAGDSCSLELSRAAVVSICFSFDEAIPAAGGVLPYDAAGARERTAAVDLLFEAGVAARLMEELNLAGLATETINYPRLRRELLARSQGNPNLLDYDRLARGMRSGAFSSRDIVMRDSFLLPAHSLEPGSWYPFDPLSPPLCAAEENRVFCGRHCFLQDGERGVLWIDETGWRFYSPEGRFDRSGAWQ